MSSEHEDSDSKMSLTENTNECCVLKTDSPFESLRKQLVEDKDYQWAFFCNLAVPIREASKLTHQSSNQLAAYLMSSLFNIDMTNHSNYSFGKTEAQRRREFHMRIHEGETFT